MASERLVSIVAALIGVAMVAVIVQSSNTSSVISASGNAFTGAVRAVMGNVGK